MKMLYSPKRDEWATGRATGGWEWSGRAWDAGAFTERAALEAVNQMPEEEKPVLAVEVTEEEARVLIQARTALDRIQGRQRMALRGLR